jgi:hypothetical protein
MPVEAGSEILNTEALSKMGPSLVRRGVCRCFRFGVEVVTRFKFVEPRFYLNRLGGAKD